MSGEVLLTGATGFLGREVLVRLAARGARVRALVRARDDAEAEKRLRAWLARRGGHERLRGIEALAADVEAPDLGLSERVRERIAGEVSEIIHAAASVSFTLPLPEARAINVEGTRNMLALAEECDRLRRFCHISTAYVAGDHPGRFGEDDFALGQAFRNTYEQTKFEAERLVRGRRRRLPVQILRPSIVVGESESGWTGSFNVLYTPLRLYARGGLPAVPAVPSSPVDVVPVDYVADAVVELASGPPEDNRTYHLVAGRQASTVGRLMELAAREFRRPRPVVLPPGAFRRVVEPLVRRRGGRAHDVFAKSSAFFPYFSLDVAYDDRRARRRLRAAGIEVTPVEDYFHRLVEFAERTRWGREALTLPEARERFAAV
jgi:long-chain acyl-CoA synthetase